MSNVGFILVAALILLLYGGTNLYIGKRIFQWLKTIFPRINGMIFGVTYALLALSLILAYSPLPATLKGIMSWMGSYWMGIYAYLLLFFVVVDLVMLLGKLMRLIPSPIPQHIRFYVGSAAILLTFGFVSYGIYNASQIKSASYDIQTNNPALTNGMKIILISDLHLGAVNSEKRLEEIVNDINDLEADVVCMAGDIFNDDYNALHNPERAMELLKSIKVKYGVYGSLGNHDSGKTFDAMVNFLEQSNIKLLNDEYVIIDERLALFGRVDPSPIGGFGNLERKDISESVASLDTNIPIVVMDHTPGQLEEYGENIDLVLSGHTHKGQIFPGSLVTNAIFDVDYGHYQKDASSPQVIVTSGVGTWGMPMRVGSNNEVVSINLH